LTSFHLTALESSVRSPQYYHSTFYRLDLMLMPRYRL